MAATHRSRPLAYDSVQKHLGPPSSSPPLSGRITVPSTPITSLVNRAKVKKKKKKKTPHGHTDHKP